MKFFDKLQNVMERIVGPFAEKLNKNKTIKALATGMMGTMAVSIGVAAICILVSLPIPGWTEFMESSGISFVGNEIMSVTLSALAIYIVVTVSYHYTMNEGENGLNSAIISLAIFLMMMPVFISGDNYFFQAIETKYIGGEGVFVGMVISVLTAKMYCFLIKKNVKLNLPDSVPPMVSNSLSPIFAAMIMFTLMAIIKYILYLTPYGNLFNFFNSIVTAPIMKLGATPISLILVYTFASTLWFFGVHPSPILSTYSVVMTAASTANIAAFAKGEILPYLSLPIIYVCLYFSATGNTLGLAFCLTKAKSTRYKSLRSITLLPNIFNINEPVIFGVPVMLNPIFFIPMVLCTLLPGLLGWLCCQFIYIPFNPTIQMPWVTPAFVTSFLQGGMPFFLLIVACIILTTVIWYPFFKIADKQAVKEEQEKAKLNGEII